MKKILAFFAMSLTAFAADLKFIPEVYPINNVKQGEVLHISLQGLNQGEALTLETVMGQGANTSNFKYPASIAKGETFKIEFDFNTEYLEGMVQENVILVEKGGKPFVARIEGTVIPELMFSEKLLDAGYYLPHEKRSFEFYVWSFDKKTRPQIKLRSDAKEFKATFKNVMLNVDKADDIKEGGKVPGVKVTLTTNNITREGMSKTQKSLRRIVGFESVNNPAAKPEVLIIGYWK